MTEVVELLISSMILILIGIEWVHSAVQDWLYRRYKK